VGSASGKKPVVGEGRKREGSLGGMDDRPECNIIQKGIGRRSLAVIRIEVRRGKKLRHLFTWGKTRVVPLSWKSSITEKSARATSQKGNVRLKRELFKVSRPRVRGVIKNESYRVQTISRCGDRKRKLVRSCVQGSMHRAYGWSAGSATQGY